jgi:signal transduction histidine kinase
VTKCALKLLKKNAPPVMCCSYLRPILLVLLLAVLLASCKAKTEQKITYNPQASAVITRLTNAGVNNSKARAHYIDSAYAQIKDIGIGDLWKKYDFLAVCCKHDNYFYRAVTYADSAILVIKDCTSDPDYNMLYAQANITKGSILLRVNNYKDASSAFYIARFAISHKKNSCEYAYVLAQIDSYLAAVSYRQQRYKEAVKRYKETVAILPDCGKGTDYFALMQGNLDNVGLSFMNDNQPDSAVLYYNKALAFIKKNEARYPEKNRYIEGAKGVIYGNRAKSFEQMDLYLAAEDDYRKSIQINSREGFENTDALYAKLGLAGMYLKVKQLDSTRRFLDSLDMPVKRDTVALLRYLTLKANYFKAIGNFQSATTALERYQDVKTQSDLITSGLGKVDFDRDFQVLDQRYTLVALKRESQLKSTYLLNAITFCVMSMIIIVFFIKSRNRSWAKMDSIDHYEAHLKLAVNAVEQKNKDLSQVLSILEHDLKMPVAAVGSMAEILLLETGRPEDERELLDLIKVTSWDLKAVIDNLFEVGNSPDLNDAEQEIIDIEKILFSSVSIMKYRAAEKNQIIYLSTCGEFFVKINGEKLWRVINNLLINAIKFSRSHTAIYVNMARNNDVIEISIKDEGVGIPLEARSRLFDLFTAAKRKGTAGEASFGLGLYTVKRIVESYGGEIWFESTENKGSTFHVAFPIKKMF